MKLTITIETSNTTDHITDDQAFFIKSELEAIVNRLHDPNFVQSTKKRIGVDELIGAVGYPQYDLCISHAINETHNTLSI